jgi:hypothetical protein
MAVAEVRLVRLWRTQAAKDWRAAKELLIRRHPERWDTNNVHHSDPPSPAIDLTRDDARLIMEMLREERERQKKFDVADATPNVAVA